jgi:succinate-semialdehyde dehydrogenase/glutarate-semialdehyde dehydrogenase
MTIASINPATGATLRVFDPHSRSEVESRVARAAARCANWSTTSAAERARLLRAAADLLDAERESLARLMTLEMGKTIRAARDEAAKCATGCRFYAEHAERMLAHEPAAVDGEDSYVAFEPLGVVLAIMPWNFPFWQVFRFAAPALAAGNVVLLKHASNVPQCALAIEDLVRRAGFPEGVLQTVLIDAARATALLADPRIAAATLTGSERAGREVGAAAGAHIKKMVLELGGSDPFIVLPSADVERAASVAVTARTVNNGQSCIAAKRFIVAEAVADDFTRRFADGMRRLRVGDPTSEETDVGPLATPQILADLESQVARTVAAGARVLTGGHRLDGPGNFYEPTVLADVPLDAAAACEETFGPVAALFRVPDADAAIRLANDSAFGLGASVWTRDRAEAERFARELQAGSVFVNAMVASDARFPFGGVKRSGYGRELSTIGLREFVNVKTVRIRGLA